MTSVSRLVWSTLRRCQHDRVLGLAAEAGFWQLLSLPAAILGILGTIGFFSGVLGADNLNHLQRSIDTAAAHVVVPSAVKSTIAPALHRILFGGRADVVSGSFIVSLWTGSSAMSTYVNTITIAYDMRGERGAVRSRLLALRLYVGFVLTTIVLLPLLVLGPDKLDGLFPDHGHLHRVAHFVTAIGYWPVVILVTMALLATLYHRAVPIRRPWRNALPGTLAAMLGWLIGSIILRAWLEFAFRRSATYGPLSAPVAVLLFLYLTALAILFGAELNAEIDRSWTRSWRRQAAPESVPEGPRPEIEGLRETDDPSPLGSVPVNSPQEPVMTNQNSGDTDG